MLRCQLHKRGQTIFEYAIVLGIVGVVLALMQTYLTRGIQGGIKVAADQVGSQVMFQDEKIPRYIGALYTSSAAHSIYSSRTNILEFGGVHINSIYETTKRAAALYGEPVSGQPISESLSGWHERIRRR